jgi:hypothetical protein
MSSVVLVVLNCLAVVGLSLGRLRGRRFNLLDPAWAFLAGYAINYCVRPILYLDDPEIGSIYQGDIYSESLIRHGVNAALWLALLGLLGFAVGDQLFERSARRFSRRLPTFPMEELARHLPYALAAFFSLLLGVAGLYGFISAAGWAGPILELLAGGQRDAFMAVILGHGYYTLAMQVSVVGWALICAKWIGLPRIRSGLRRLAHSVLRYAWLLSTLVIWVVFGERSSMLAVIFVPFAFYFTIAPTDSEMARRKRRIATVWVLVGVLCFVAVAGPIGLLMKGKEFTFAGAAAMAISAWDSLEFTVAAQHYIGLGGVYWGRTYIGDLVYSWLPRAAFPWKPERYGVILVQDRIAPELMDNVGATFPPGILAEAYANFWYFGVFLVPMGLAFVFRGFYYRLEERDWFWLIQLALLFPLIASFRSVGWNAAALAVNLLIVGIVASFCSAMLSLRRALTALPAYPTGPRSIGLN